jgi:UDP-N-acetylglucosamine 2-epimerase (hydrolysing)
MKKRLITFLTGTRADFGKLRPLILETKSAPGISVEVVATGMHLLTSHGYTIHEIYKAGIQQVFPIFNQDSSTSEKMDVVLANTVIQLGHYLNERRPDLLIVHGDRVEALGGAIAGSLNNILVAHIEGGEKSGTIDDSMRHAITKMSHVHFVANNEAQRRVLQMGEDEKTIFAIGSPEVDVMLSDDLPTLAQAKKRYSIKFDDYAVFVYHPVTTENNLLGDKISNVIDAMVNTGHNFITILPNNDVGSGIINSKIQEFGNLPRVKVFPSLRFEFYLSLLKHARYIAGNSSSGVREAPIYGVPCVNIGTRQSNRNNSKAIFNVDENKNRILDVIASLPHRVEKIATFGDGKTAKRFSEIIGSGDIWSIQTQKKFIDRSSK